MRDEQPPDRWVGQPVSPPYESRHRPTVPDEGGSAKPPTKTAAHRAPDRAASWWNRLPFLPKIAAITAGLVLLSWGGIVLVGLFTDSPTSRAGAPSGAVASYSEQAPDPEGVLPAASMDPATPTSGPTATTTGSGVDNGAPGTSGRETIVETRMVVETQAIPYDTETVRDNSLPKGTSTVRTSGVPGVRTLTYKVTYTNDVQTAKELVKSVVTTEPVTEVVAIGTMPDTKCDPNYSGCVPIASDVDCAGDGDGPAYVHAPVDVIGSDIYGLDPDGNGVGCG